MHEHSLSAFNIEHFGGAPGDEEEPYTTTADDVFMGFVMRVSDLMHAAADSGRSHEAITLASFVAASSPEKGIRGGRWVARMWDEYCARP